MSADADAEMQKRFDAVVREKHIRLTIARMKLALAINRHVIATYLVVLAEQHADDLRRGGDIA